MNAPYVATAFPGDERLPPPVAEQSGTVAWHRLDPPAIAAVAAELRRAAEPLRRLSFAERCERIGAVSAACRDDRAWLDHTSRWIEQIEGWDAGMVRDALRHLLRGLTAPMLRELARREGCDGTAAGPTLVTILASGNLPVAALPHVVYALTLGSGVLVRVSRGDPVTLRCWRDALVRHRPEFADALALLRWERDDSSALAAATTSADLILSFGSDAALAAIRSHLPAGKPFLAYGARLSLGLVVGPLAEERARQRIAHLAARDVVLFDQRGCHSPRAIYVEEQGVPFAEALAGALPRWRARWPQRPRSREIALAAHHWLARAEMTALRAREARVWSSESRAEWSVLFDPDPELASLPPPGHVLVKPLPSPSALAAALDRYRPALDTAAIAGRPADLRQWLPILREVGFRRLCRLGRAQEPDLLEPHDGLPRLRILLDPLQASHPPLLAVDRSLRQLLDSA